MSGLATKAAEPADGTALAVRALLYAAIELPIDACKELIRQLLGHVAVATQDFAGDINRRRPDAEVRAITALRDLASRLGRSPSTSDYTNEYDRRRINGENPIPTAGAIIKRFGSWEAALSAAGLHVPELSRVNVRRHVGKRRVYRYPTERIIECLRACARDLGYPPTVRDYNAWRDEKLGGNAGRRRVGADIPHYRTVEQRFGSWNAGIGVAGLDPAPENRRKAFSAV
jgi:hypothetical protein